MFEIILMVSLGAMAPAQTSVTQPAVAPAIQTAQFSPCVWPNRCAQTAPAAAQFRPCVWPNKCKEESPAAAPALAQFSPCVWPNRCKDAAPVVAQFRPCVWPNKCAASDSIID